MRRHGVGQRDDSDRAQVKSLGRSAHTQPRGGASRHACEQRTALPSRDSDHKRHQVHVSMLTGLPAPSLAHSFGSSLRQLYAWCIELPATRAYTLCTGRCWHGGCQNDASATTNPTLGVGPTHARPMPNAQFNAPWFIRPNDNHRHLSHARFETLSPRGKHMARCVVLPPHATPVSAFAHGFAQILRPGDLATGQAQRHASGAVASLNRTERVRSNFGRCLEAKDR